MTFDGARQALAGQVARSSMFSMPLSWAATPVKVGCQTSTWEMLGHGWRGTVDHLLRAVAAAGYAGIEISDTMLGSYADRPAAFQDALDLHGLTLVAVVCGSASGFTEPDAMAADLDIIDRNLRFTSAFPDAILLLGSAKSKVPGNGDAKIEAAARFYNAAGACGQRVGVPVALHPSSSRASLIRSRADYDRIMRLTDPALIGWVPDTGHLLRGGHDMMDTLRSYIGRIRYLHLKDVDEAGRWQILGTGRCGTRAVVDLVRRAPNFTGWLVLEEESEVAAQDPAAAVLANRDTMRVVIG